MFHQTESERLREEIRDREEQIKFFSRLYKKGAGCFGVSRGSKEVKKELDKLLKKN